MDERFLSLISFSRPLTEDLPKERIRVCGKIMSLLAQALFLFSLLFLRFFGDFKKNVVLSNSKHRFLPFSDSFLYLFPILLLVFSLLPLWRFLQGSCGFFFFYRGFSTKNKRMILQSFFWKEKWCDKYKDKTKHHSTTRWNIKKEWAQNTNGNAKYVETNAEKKRTTKAFPYLLGCENRNDEKAAHQQSSNNIKGKGNENSHKNHQQHFKQSSV